MAKTSKPRKTLAKPKPRVPVRPRIRLETDERRAQLLELAQLAFATRSYDEVSIDDVARAAGVSKGLLYHYFPTKRDLYIAGLREAARQLIERTVVARSPEIAPLEGVRAGLDAYLEFAWDHADAYTALLRGGIGSDPEVAAVVEETRTIYVESLLEGVRTSPLPLPPGDTPLLRVALRGWVGFVEQTSLDWVSRPIGVTQSELRDLLADVLFSTLQRVVKGTA